MWGDLTMKFEKWISRCEWYSEGSGDFPQEISQILEAMR